MPLGAEIGLGPGDIVLDGGPPPHGKGHSPHTTGMSIVAKRLDGSGHHLVGHWGRPRLRQHCVRWGCSSPTETGTAAPSSRPMSIVAKPSPISATAELLFLSGQPSFPKLPPPTSLLYTTTRFDLSLVCGARSRTSADPCLLLADGWPSPGQTDQTDWTFGCCWPAAAVPAAASAIDIEHAYKSDVADSKSVFILHHHISRRSVTKRRRAARMGFFQYQNGATRGHMSPIARCP